MKNTSISLYDEASEETFEAIDLNQPLCIQYTALVADRTAAFKPPSGCCVCRVSLSRLELGGYTFVRVNQLFTEENG